MAMASRGRDALHLIIEGLDQPRGSGVLLPALACPEVYRPFLDRGHSPHFYRVGRDLRPDLGQIERHRRDCSTILVINYYGFVQTKEVYGQLREWGLVVIEDGSHSLLSTGSGEGGLAYFASLRKLLPLPDGAIYRVKGGVSEKKRFFRETGLHAFRMARLAAIWLKRFEQVKPRRMQQKTIRELFWEAEKQLGRYEVPAPAWAMSRSILTGMDINYIRGKRRKNYLTLAGLLSGLNGLNVLCPVLPPGTVPYGLPVLAEERDRLASEMDRLNVQAAPLWDLSKMVPAGTGVDREFHERIMLLPVGQDYDEDDMAALADRIKHRQWG